METNIIIKMENIKNKDFEIQNLTPQIGEFKFTKPQEEYTGFDTNYLIYSVFRLICS